MLLINIYFFILFIKIFLFFKVNALSVLNKIKPILTYYLIYDIHVSFAVIIINLTYYENNFLKTLIMGSGTISFLCQCYQIFLLSKVICKEEKKLKTGEYFLLLFGFIIAVSRLFFSINIYLKTHNDIHIANIFESSKLLFFTILLIFTLFQLYFVLPGILHVFFYIKHYKIKNGPIQKSLYLLFTLILIKVLLEYYQLNIMQFFKILNLYDSAEIEQQSNQFLDIISLFSFTIYIAIFYFIKNIKGIMNKKYIYLSSRQKINKFLFIGVNDIININLQEKSFLDFVLMVALQNIQKKLSLTSEVFFIFQTPTKDTANDLFEETHCLYTPAKKEKVLFYDDYYNYLYAMYLNDDLESPESIYKKTLLHSLEENKMRVLIPINQKEQLFCFLCISFHSFSKKLSLNDNDIEYCYDIAKYIEATLEKVCKDPFYLRLTYENKIIELNLEENNNLFQQFYLDIKTKISKICQIIVTEDKKQSLSIYAPDHMEVDDIIKMIHTNSKDKDIEHCQEEFVFSESEKGQISIFSSPKIKLGKIKISIHTCLPFLNRKSSILSIALAKKKIDDIFPESMHTLKEDKFFFCQFDLNYSIKIIINIENKHTSFFKIIDYISEIACVYISLNNAHINQKKILEYYNYLLHSDKKYYIFFTDLEMNNYDFQYKLLDLYINYVIETTTAIIKLFFVIKNENEIKQVHYKIIQMSSSLLFKPSSIINITLNDILEIVKNYSWFILKKKYTQEILQKYAQENYFLLKENISLYNFLDLFEKTIQGYTLKNIPSTHSREFYIKEGARLGKAAFKNIILMDELLRIYDNNYTHIALLLTVHKSSVSRYFNKRKNLKS